MQDVIDSFRDEFRFLSNFHPSPMRVGNIGIHAVQIVPTAEHFFQAMKTKNIQEQQRIIDCDTPGQAKRMGRTVTLRSDWENVKLHVMRMAVEEKFRQNHDLAKLLIATGDAKLIEGNLFHDTFWGVDANTGQGLNNLGHILMDVRTSLQKIFL